MVRLPVSDIVAESRCAHGVWEEGEEGDRERTLDP